RAGCPPLRLPQVGGLHQERCVQPDETGANRWRQPSRLNTLMPLPSLDSVVTPRLVLREIRADDLPDLMEVNGDPEVTRFLPYATWESPADAAAWLERMNKLAATGSARDRKS